MSVKAIITVSDDYSKIIGTRVVCEGPPMVVLHWRERWVECSSCGLVVKVGSEVDSLDELFEVYREHREGS